jgi:hypothetical protein
MFVVFGGFAVMISSCVRHETPPRQRSSTGLRVNYAAVNIAFRPGIGQPRAVTRSPGNGARQKRAFSNAAHSSEFRLSRGHYGRGNVYLTKDALCVDVASLDSERIVVSYIDSSRASPGRATQMPSDSS